jgi:hypothetical protein
MIKKLDTVEQHILSQGNPLKIFSGFWLALTLSLLGLPPTTNGAVELIVEPLEAEQARFSGAGIRTNHGGYTGTGYVDYTDHGFIEWDVEVETAGLYQLEFRYAFGTADDRLLNIVGNDGILIISELVFPSTQQFDNWQTISVFAKLDAGFNIIRAETVTDNGPNIDHLLVSPTPPDLNRFLSFPLYSSHSVFRGSEQNAQAYYKVIDPFDRRTTFDDWKAVNGFSFSGAEDAHAVYLNGADLNFGRSMFVKTRSNGDVASYVQNYPTLADAINNTNLIATVAMEYRAPENDPSAPKFTTFYVFGATGERLTKIDLDGRGEKYVPGLCNVCHGGKPKQGGFHGSIATYEDQGDTGAKWIPWDLDTYKFHPSLTRQTQEAEFKKLNAAVFGTNPTSAAKVLINGWYGGDGMPNETFDGGFVPRGWQNTSDGDKSELYLKVVAPSCRACHNQRGTYNNSGHPVFQGEQLEASLEFGTYNAFKGYRDEIESLVYDQGLMPLAKQTYELFWRSNQPKILDDELFAGKAYQDPPASVYPNIARFDFGDLRRPGRPLARIAGARFFQDSFPIDEYLFMDVQEGLKVRLNAGPSSFASQIRWIMQSAPGDLPTIDNNRSALATFDLDPDASADIRTAGTSPYRIRLSVSNDFATYNDIIQGQLWSDSTLKPLVFSDNSASTDDIYDLLITNYPSTRSSTPLSCIHCHSNGGVMSRAEGIFMLRDFDQPRGENDAIWKSYAFNQMLTRINCNDPENSLILKKSAGHHHWNQTVSGFSNQGNSGDVNRRAKILRWIMEGARFDLSSDSKLGCPGRTPVVIVNPPLPIIAPAPVTLNTPSRLDASQ